MHYLCSLRLARPRPRPVIVVTVLSIRPGVAAKRRDAMTFASVAVTLGSGSARGQLVAVRFSWMEGCTATAAVLRRR